MSAFPTRGPGHPTRAATICCLVVLAAAPGCGRRSASPPFPVALEPRADVRLPARDAELAQVLDVVTNHGGALSLDAPEDRDRLARALGRMTSTDPFAHPESFPADEDVLAWLVNAHSAWVVALHSASALAGRDPEALRTVPFPLAGGEWTLERLEREVISRAPSEPRLALCLNPGFAGGPPLPETTLEGHALTWQLAEHATRCGRAPAFWAFDPARRELAVSAFTAFMPGLPASLPQRARRLLDLVPPPPELRAATISACGEALQRCTVTLTPLDTRRRR